MLLQKWILVSWVQLIVFHYLSAAKPTPLPYSGAFDVSDESDDTEWIMEEFVPYLWKIYNGTADARRNSSVEDTEASYEDVNTRIGMAPSTSLASSNARRDQDRRASTHSDNRPHMCGYPGCGKAFKRNGHLKEHARTHSRERLYNCTVPGCGRRFTGVRNMNWHVRLVHTGGRPYMCNYAGCEKTFKQKSHLSTHVSSVHRGERPYTCNYSGCEKAFNQKGHLNKHVKWAHGRERPL